LLATRINREKHSTPRQTRGLLRAFSTALVQVRRGRPPKFALDESTSLADFELTVRDTLERRDLESRERSLVAALSDILRQARRDTRLTVRRILVLSARGPRARARRARWRPL
jgi:hypothetical protein